MMEIKDYLRIFFIGMGMGIANIIPGVSGGTIAVVFGIYEQLMEALGNFLTDKNKRWHYIRFLAVLFSGSVIAVIALASLLSWAFDNYPLMTIYFFMGLILGSIPVVINTHEDMKINYTRVISMIIGIALVVWLAILQSGAGQEKEFSQFTDYSVQDYLYFILSGVIASSAMIIPGVSGSFILILLGVYWTVLSALSGLTSMIIEGGFSASVIIRLYILGSLFIGIIIGILGFSRVMDWALKKFPAVTMYGILGLLIGSLYQLFPGYEFTLNGLGAAAMFIGGVFISIKFSK